MKAIINNIEFPISRVNIMKSKSEDSEQSTLSRIEITFSDSVKFEDISTMEESAYAAVIIRTESGDTTKDRTFEGYEFSNLNQFISDLSTRMTLTLSKLPAAN